MNDAERYVPNILICGDKTDFLSRIGQRPYNLVGEIKFFGEFEGKSFDFVQDGKFWFNGKIFDKRDIVSMMRENKIDYIVFCDMRVLFKNDGLLNDRGAKILSKVCYEQTLPLDDFRNLPERNFIGNGHDINLLWILRLISCKTLLDFDAHFATSRLIWNSVNNLTKIDCISEKDVFPIKENFYSHVYKSFSECQFKHYDAALLVKESAADFDKCALLLRNCTDVIITYVKNNSKLKNHIFNEIDIFSEIKVRPYIDGEWLFCTPHRPQEDFAIYVATHKKMPTELIEKLPEGYKIVQSGRAISEDLGYIGDDTGDNISYLNPYVSEIDVLYWIWKNTSHSPRSIIGLCHYRRFFTTISFENLLVNAECRQLSKISSGEILDADAVKKILEDYDIGLFALYHRCTIYTIICDTCNRQDVNDACAIIKKYLKQMYPDYLDAFEHVCNTEIYFACNMFVTRKYVMDAYCSWLFSFFIDATKEIVKSLELDKKTGNIKRLPGYITEWLLNAWVINNRLRVKDMRMVFVEGV